jgi:hypothetical protein
MNPSSKPLRVLRRAVLVVVVLSAAVFVWWYEVTPRTPEEAMAAFYAQRNDGITAEDQLIDPLVLAGDRAVPVVLREVVRAEMPLRRYAISFLGNAQSPEAVPVLQRILENSAEEDVFRGDALEALWAIGVPGREALAQRFASREDYLGQTASRLLAGYKPERRTYWQALRHRHE